MTKKHLIVIVSIVVAALLLWLIFREPKHIDSHGDDKSRLTAERDSFQVHEATGLHKIDSLESASRRKDSAINQLKAEQTTTRKALDKTTATANRLAGEVKVLRRSDTSEFGRKCDSLAEEAMSFKFLYEQYKAYADSLTTVMDSRSDDYVKALEERRKLYDELKQKYDHVYDGYSTLYEDLRSANRTIKRERLKTKIAALLGLIGGAAAVFK